MQISSLSTPSFDFRRTFSDICAPGLNRYLATSTQLAGDDFDADRRAGYAKSYTRDLWRALKAAQSVAEYDEPWSASRAAEIASEFEFNVTDSERRAVADPSYLRPFGGGEALDREMALQALSIWAPTADQDRYGAEVVAAFLPIAKAQRGGKDDDPAFVNHIDCLAQAFVWKFINEKKKVAASDGPEAASLDQAEAEAEPKADARANASRKAASSHPLDGITLGSGVDWTRPGGALGLMSDWIMATARRPNRPLAVAASVAVLSTLCGRHLYGPTGTALNVYLACLAESTVGKDRPFKAVAEILDACGYGNLHQTAKVFSVSGFEQLIAETSLLLGGGRRNGDQSARPYFEQKGVDARDNDQGHAARVVVAVNW